MRRSARRASVGLALSAVVLAGCGSSSGSGSSPGPKAAALDPTALVAASYTKLTDTKTAKISLSMNLSASGTEGGQYTFTGDGAQDFAAKTAQLTISLPENAGSVETRFVNRTVYEKLPAKEAPAFHGKWLKINIDQATKAAGVGSAGDLGSNDPSQILQMLSSVSNGVTKVGDEQVRGVNTTHYHAIVDLQKASARAGNSPAQIDRLKQMLGTSSYPVDVWVDDSGLPHRLQYQMPLPKQATQGSGMTDAKLMATEEFYDFGSPVTVEAPPADQTVDAAQLSGRGGAGGTSSSAGRTTGA